MQGRTRAYPTNMGGNRRNPVKDVSNDIEMIKRCSTHESHLENGPCFEFHVLTSDFLTNLINGLGDKFTLVILIRS
jgi:hypothetical protein